MVLVVPPTTCSERHLFQEVAVDRKARAVNKDCCLIVLKEGIVPVVVVVPPTTTSEELFLKRERRGR